MLEDYIQSSWKKLLRNSLDVALDPKISGDRRTYLYIPPNEDAASINMMVHARREQTANLGAIEVKALPDDLIVTENHGILYLPYDYIVPGGRFNEMYGWDSYWIVLGLLEDGYASLARGIVENFIYQIKNYGGKILNANRTYYLTRSQPPMLAAMGMAVLPTVKSDERTDFLQRLSDATALEYVGFWKASRYDSDHGLFHYGDSQQGYLGPCPEVAFGERDDKGFSHYDKIAAYLKDLDPKEILRQRFYDEATGGLSHDAIAGDRAMRESGFDASMNMGYFGLETIDFDPVCLNSLLYVQCQLLEGMYTDLGQRERAQFFQKEAADLKEAILKFTWNEEAQLFSNYNRRLNLPSPIPYLTCAYPLWAGIASKEQAQRFREKLPIFETEFGIKSTDRQTGCQWDAPFMWAPLVYFAVAGLRKYGFDQDARRIAQKFVDTIRRVNDAEGANFEKYNAETGTHRTDGIIEVGYDENVVGFGWTNGVVLTLEKWLKDEGGRV